MGEAAHLFLHAMLGDQCTFFAMFFLYVLLTLFPVAFTLGQAVCREYFNSERLAKL